MQEETHHNLDPNLSIEDLPTDQIIRLEDTYFSMVGYF